MSALPCIPSELGTPGAPKQQSQPHSAAIRISVSVEGRLTFFQRRRATASGSNWRRFSVDALRLYHQPIVPLQSGAATLSCEVLCRFRAADGTTQAPLDFIDAAEERGLMPILDRRILAMALAQIARNARPVGSPRICVNISAQSLADPTFPDFVLQQLDLNHLTGNELCLEITETAPIKDVSSAHAGMSRLRSRGCAFALDDFGTGFASVDMLMRLPLDYIKIPGQFVCEQTEANAEILRFIVALSRQLRLPMIAEHVNSQAVLSRMRDYGVQYAQGYAVGNIEPFAVAV